MIQPEQIQRKAEKLYRPFLLAWLAGDESFFPRVIPTEKSLNKNDLAASIKAVDRLREGSKEKRGYGYSVEWIEVNSPNFGRNPRVKRIQFDTQDDLLRLIGKQRDFAMFAKAVGALRAEFPALQDWIKSNVTRMMDVAEEIDGLLHVLRFFQKNPRPQLYIRELPIPVDTKFIERNQRVLREWLDQVLPPSTIIADEKDFERRYGLCYSGNHILVRLLDSQLAKELGFPCDEFSLPLHTLGTLCVERATTFIVENRINLLTLPRMSRSLVIGRMGDAVTLLHHIPWLSRTTITYWGDMDVEGFEILSSLRAIFPHVRSVFMDGDTFERWRNLASDGNGSRTPIPPHLTDEETAAFIRCRDDNLRIEQEHSPHQAVKQVLTGLSNDHHWTILPDESLSPYNLSKEWHGIDQRHVDNSPTNRGVMSGEVR